ncbi:hypothetical protein CSB20_05780 [bacterium DOLZORAL124_64_63]|nr:MAG: hypothetical protein CSB20_05780 [bacterium DOLZORAL124_64_63]
MLDLDRLNAHSRLFADMLFKRWPEWLQHARFDPYEDFEKEALLVEVPRPVDGSSHGLFITTSEWEVSIGFGENFHSRFGSSGDPDEGNFMDEALHFLNDFVNEDVVIATASENGEWLGGWKIDRHRENLDDVAVEPGVHLRIRSWLGTYDREYQA